MERALGLELRTLSDLTRRYFDQYSHKKCIEAITGTNSWIIAYIGRKTDEGTDVYQRDLEMHFGVTRSTASKVINLMVTKGLIMRESVPHDARLKKLTLTPKAQEIKRLMDEDHARFEQILREDFDENELNMLFDCLDRMKKNLNELSKEATQDD